MARAVYGPPLAEPRPGGLQVAVYLVPVIDGGIVAFEVTGGSVRGRWLPWAVIDHGQGPWEAAAVLADDWLGQPPEAMSLVDVLALDLAGAGHELAIVFRVVPMAMPAGDPERQPVLYPPGEFDAIGAFDPVDLERWAQAPVPPADTAGERLVF